MEYENQYVSILCPENVFFFDMRNSVLKYATIQQISAQVDTMLSKFPKIDFFNINKGENKPNGLL